jgi:hypothetical protein
MNYCQEWLRVVKFYTYLGTILQISSKTVNVHIKEKAASAIHGMADIEGLSKLFLERAVKLFDVKIVLVFTNSQEILWVRLRGVGGDNLTTLESMKATELKNALRTLKISMSLNVHPLAAGISPREEKVCW